MNDETKPVIKVAFLFLRGREAVRKAIEAGVASDMPLYGTNHAAQALGATYACDYVEIGGLWPTLWKLTSYDVVFAHSGITIFALQSLLLRHKPRWIFLAINTVTVLSNYPPRSLKRYLMLWSLRRMERIVCVSIAQRDYLADNGIASERLEVILFGTDKTFFAPSHVDEGSILSVGRDMGRDYKPLLAAAKMIDASFHIVAAPRNIEGEHITEIPPNVKLEYGRPWTEYRDILAKSRISVVPLKRDGARDSSDCSGQTVALDSLSSEKALVITRRAWTGEYLKNGEHALFVEPGDAEGIAEALGRLLSDPALRERLAAAGRTLVEEKLNTERMGAEIARVIQNL